jgi:hypothetical protein
MTTDAGFSVHLQSLEAFAQELAAQLDAMQRPSDRLYVLAGQGLPLGEFGEAHVLAARHAEVAGQMHALLSAVQEAVAFASEVTKTIATSYQSFDEGAAANYQNPGVITGPAAVAGAAAAAAGGAAGAGGSGSGATPIAVNVSIPSSATVTVDGNVPAGLPVTVTEQPFTYSDPTQAPLVHGADPGPPPDPIVR